MRLALALIAVVAVAGCPKKKPADAEPPTPSEVRPTVVRTWEELTPDLYAEFADLAEWGITPTVGQLLERHDTDLWTRREVTWANGQLPVIEFLDTDRRTTDASAIAAWVLSPEPEIEDDRLLPQKAPGILPTRTVRAVVIRDYTGAPSAASPQELADVLMPVFPPPWIFCIPDSLPETVVMYDVKRGFKLGLFSDQSKDSGAWTVDHVEFLSPGFAPADWWATKGYGDCVGFEAMDAQGRGRKLRGAR